MHYTGAILAAIREALRSSPDPLKRVTVDNHQANGAYGVHQARVQLAGDPATYRLIIAPADAPITINGRPIGEHFALPLGDR